MVTLVGYIALYAMFGENWTGWLMVLPVLQDLVILGWIERVRG